MEIRTCARYSCWEGQKVPESPPTLSPLPITSWPPPGMPCGALETGTPEAQQSLQCPSPKKIALIKKEKEPTMEGE